MTGPLDRLSDDDLVAICNDGGAADAAAAFNTLYRRHKDYVLRVAMRFLGDHDAALDVLQETFGYLLGKFPPPGKGLTLTARLTTFLYPVAKNNAITLIRKTHRDGEAVDPDSLPSPHVDADDDLGRILSVLPADRREVLTLRFVDDLSLREIADVLEIPLGTVKSRLHLAVKLLRESPEIKKTYFS